MNCKACQKESDNYREGKLSDDLRIQIVTHLKNCAECADNYRLMSLAESIINQERAIEPNHDFTSRIMGRIEKIEESEIKVRIPFMRVLQPALIITSIAATIFIGVLIGNIYKPANTGNARPIELSLIDDAAIESIDILSNEY
jgi:predicted anti-sigma-YlaC factor YlaD